MMSGTNTDDKNTTPPWAKDLPHPEYALFPRVLEEDPWYEIYLVASGIYAFYEPGHFQEVISFLVLGSDKALLWDTGMGFAPLKPLIQKLTFLPLTVINSHLHLDHVAGNHEFGAAYAWPSSAALMARQGRSNDLLGRSLTAESFAKPLPTGMSTQNYTIQPWAFLPIPQGNDLPDGFGFTTSIRDLSSIHAEAQELFTGTAFDLGDRQLDILYTPGHSIDSIMLFDSLTNGIFTGDTVYPASLYAHLLSEEFDVFATYCDTMRRLQLLEPACSCIYPSHNLPLYDKGLLGRVATKMTAIEEGTATGEATPYSSLLTYRGKDFSVIVRHL